jgi:hypothetical protein
MVISGQWVHNGCGHVECVVCIQRTWSEDLRDSCVLGFARKSKERGDSFCLSAYIPSQSYNSLTTSQDILSGGAERLKDILLGGAESMGMLCRVRKAMEGFGQTP